MSPPSACTFSARTVELCSEWIAQRSRGTPCRPTRIRRSSSRREGFWTYQSKTASSSVVFFSCVLGHPLASGPVFGGLPLRFPVDFLLRVVFLTPGFRPLLFPPSSDNSWSITPSFPTNSALCSLRVSTKAVRSFLNSSISIKDTWLRVSLIYTGCLHHVTPGGMIRQQVRHLSGSECSFIWL